MAALGRIAFQFARTPVGGRLVGTVFTHFTGFLPVQVIRQDAAVFAFVHPSPMAKPHILVVPKHRVPTILWLLKYADAAAIIDGLDRALSEIAASCFANYGGAMRVFCNGGCRQDVAQMHWHAVPSEVGIRGWREDPAERQDAVSARGADVAAGRFSHLVHTMGDGAWAAGTALSQLLRSMPAPPRAAMAGARGFTLVYGDPRDGIWRPDGWRALHLTVE